MTYRYIATDRSFVLRDNRVIEWDAKTDAPSGEDEQKLWREAGSPKPEYPPGVRAAGYQRGVVP
jgi:hypothetical protein